eukprot:750682_1
MAGGVTTRFEKSAVEFRTHCYCTVTSSVFMHSRSDEISIAQTCSENTERHCFSLVSLLLMVASRSGTVRSELSSPAWLGVMMSCFVHPEAFSPRLLRHLLHLCRLIIPLVSPTSVGEAMVSLDGEDLAAPVSPLWPRLDCAQAPPPGCDVPESAFRFADLLLRAIGFISCVTHLPSLVSQLPSKKRRMMLAEYIGLINSLFQISAPPHLAEDMSAWDKVIELVCRKSLEYLPTFETSLKASHVREISAQQYEAVFRSWGTLCLMAPLADILRVGARCSVKCTRASLDQDSRGTIVGMNKSNAMVILDKDKSMTPRSVRLSDVTIMPFNADRNTDGHNFCELVDIASLRSLVGLIHVSPTLNAEHAPRVEAATE